MSFLLTCDIDLDFPKVTADFLHFYLDLDPKKANLGQQVDRLNDIGLCNTYINEKA